MLYKKYVYLPSVSSPLPHPDRVLLTHASLKLTLLLFPANINPDGLYQCFVSLYLFFPDSVSSGPLHCIQNLNFDPPTTCQTADL